MTQLSTKEILKDKKTHDPNSITSLSPTHKALTNVSCLSAFKNLERLDLTFNNLTSLQGLESCLNLKWLSVQQNSLHSLKGIEGLTNLTVFNAGKNKLRSMEEVRNLLKLRALILNDNEIASISGLDQLKELNTLVLSRNPIRKMGNSLAKLKSIMKISLSNCQLEAIDSSIKACTGLEQLRLAHNEIKALSSLSSLKNLNLLGNPIAEKAKLVKKVSKLVPALQTFNAKRMEKWSKVQIDQKVEDAAVSAADDSEPKTKKKKDNRDKLKAEEQNSRKTGTSHVAEEEFDEADNDRKIENNKQKKKKEKHVEQETQVQEPEKTSDKRSKRKADKAGIDVIDDKETPFAEILTYDSIENTKSNGGERRDEQAARNVDSISALVTYPGKKKKANNKGASALQFLTPAAEVGLGGPSAWDE